MCGEGDLILKTLHSPGKIADSYQENPFNFNKEPSVTRLYDHKRRKKHNHMIINKNLAVAIESAKSQQKTME